METIGIICFTHIGPRARKSQSPAPQAPNEQSWIPSQLQILNPIVETLHSSILNPNTETMNPEA